VRIYKISDAANAEASLKCSAAAVRTVPVLGRVSARRCVDSLLGLETVVTSLDRGKRRFLSSAVASQQDPPRKPFESWPAGRLQLRIAIALLSQPSTSLRYCQHPAQ
jgi:hypothetical protein